MNEEQSTKNEERNGQRRTANETGNAFRGSVRSFFVPCSVLRTSYFVLRSSFALLLLTLPVSATGQTSDRTDALVAAVRPALPYPAADAAGEVPEQGGERAKWFVVWPAQGENRITVRANPLHPDTQASSAAAMKTIQEAVVAAERKAQDAYSRAVDELKRTGKATELSGVTLDDEGIAGERIDAELEFTIDIEPSSSFEIGSSRAPAVSSGSNGVTWIISTASNTYRDGSGADARDRFRPAETRLIFGSVAQPTVRRRGEDHRFDVTVAPGAFAVVLRGNEQLLKEVLAGAEWSRFTRKAP